MSKIKPNIVRGGTAIDLGNNLYLMRGRKHSSGGIDIGRNPRTGLEVEGDEVVQTSPSGLRVFSAQPILNGISPAQYILGGANPNDVFNAQEFWKKANRVTDDGKKYRTGGKVDEKTFTTKLTKKQEDKFQNWYKNVSYELGLDSNPDNPLYAYDYRGFWLENRNKDIDYKQPDFHFTDTYKKPDHPTFSVESKYADKKYGIDPKTVGHWDGENFISGSFNDLIAARTDRPTKQLEYSKQPYEPSKEIIDYIKSTEGFRDKWYQDGKGIWTVGYGFTGSKVRKMFPNGMTREQADKYLTDSLNVRKQILQRDTPNWDSLNQNQRDALLSYHYNIGEGKYRNSPNMQRGLEEKDWDTVSINIDAGYNDKKNPGLRKRRDYERNLFNTPVEYKYGGRVKKELGGNDDFSTIRKRKDFKPTPFQKLVVDKFGSKFYPNPVGIHGDFSRFYFGRKTNNDTFYKSNYKPTKSKNEDAVYYGVKDIRFLNNLIALYNSENNKLTEIGKNQNLSGYKARDPVITAKNKALVSELPENYNRKTSEYMLSEGIAALGNFTVGRGKDEKGEYLSYYDIWDTDPKFSHNIEKRGLAKPYEIYDRIYGTFDKDGTFHPEGEIGESYINDEKKYGGIHIKPSKRGTFTAAAKKHGMSVQGFASKVLANKSNYSSSMVKKANFARNASKWKHKEFGGEESGVLVLQRKGRKISTINDIPKIEKGKYLSQQSKDYFSQFKDYNDYLTNNKLSVDERNWSDKQADYYYNNSGSYKEYYDLIDTVSKYNKKRKEYESAFSVPTGGKSYKLKSVVNGKPTNKNLLNVDESVLNYIYDESIKGNVDPKVAIALATNESNLGNSRNKDGKLNAFDLYSYWAGTGSVVYPNSKTTDPYNNIIKKNPSELTEEDINIIRDLKDKYNYMNEHIHPYKGTNPTKDAVKYFLSGKYPGLAVPQERIDNYNKLVMSRFDELMNDNRFKTWYNNKSKRKFGGDMTYSYILGKNNIYRLGDSRKRAPYGDEIIWRPTSQDLHRPRLTRKDIDYGYVNGVLYDRFGNAKFDTDIEPAVAVAEKPSLGLNIGIDDKRFSSYTSEELDAMRKSIVDKYQNEPVGNSLEVTNPITLNNTVPNPGNGFMKSNNTTKENKVKGNGVNSDLIGAGINLVGNLGSFLINNVALNKMKYYNMLPLRANKLKTNFNINPQLDNIRENVADFEEDTRNNTASSKVALSRRQRMRARGAQAINQLYGQKENIETQLINRDRLNQQQVANQNVSMRNQWRAGLSEFRNKKLEAKAENAVAAINNAADAIAGPSGYLARRERRLENDRLLARDLLSLELLSATNPDAAPIVDDIIKNGIDSRYYKLLKKQRSV